MKRIGILGAGQLGAYLCRAARDLGMHATVVADTEHDVAVKHADAVLVGELEDEGLLDQLIDGCDVITFEKEDISVAVLQTLSEAENAQRVKIAPGVETLLLFQNKAKQKTWYADHNIPTAAFVIPPLELNFTVLAAELGTPFVLKTQRGGYDGLGVKVIRCEQDLAPFQGVPTMAEAYIEHKRELAVMVARSHSGECVSYPCFEMFFNAKGNVLRHVVAPALLDESLVSEARTLSVNIVEQLQGVGIFAVELFLQQDNTLLVNEIAPRVHNSGHMTIESQPTSQFEQHLRAICDLPLGAVEPHNAGAMINLLVEPEIEEACRVGRSIVSAGNDSYIHWYGKEELRPLRKMGHITATGADNTAALAAAEQCLKNLAESHE